MSHTQACRPFSAERNAAVCRRHVGGARIGPILIPRFGVENLDNHRESEFSCPAGKPPRHREPGHRTNPPNHGAATISVAIFQKNCNPDILTRPPTSPPRGIVCVSVDQCVDQPFWGAGVACVRSGLTAKRTIDLELIAAAERLHGLPNWQDA